VVHSVGVEPSVLRRLLDLHASAGASEPCALLLGAASAREIRVEDACPAENVHPRPDVAFEAAPGACLEAARRARESGRAIVGAFHGHGARRADLSTSDATALLHAAAAPGSEGEPVPVPFAYLVSGRGAGRAPVLRGFVAHGGHVRERPVVARPRAKLPPPPDGARALP
jgi:proteasome lid subunit RPN8/RPN11